VDRTSKEGYREHSGTDADPYHNRLGHAGHSPDKELESAWPRPTTRFLAKETAKSTCTYGSVVSEELDGGLPSVDDQRKNGAAAEGQGEGDRCGKLQTNYVSPNDVEALVGNDQ